MTGTRAPRRGAAGQVLGGAAALGAGAALERGLGFAANLLAARLGGASAFGAYAVALATAANLSTYAGGGIGATAARFSGKYPRGSAGYGALARALLLVALVSSALAAAAMLAGAAPLARLLGKPGLAPLLRWAAAASAGIVLLECARGFFTGQRRLRALLLLGLLTGGTMLAALPLAARRAGPQAMILVQALAAAGSAGVCLVFGRGLGLTGPADSSASSPATSPAQAGEPVRVGAVAREVWGFGLVQLAGLAGMNAAGWWLTALVARGDPTLAEMGFFAVASQMRNLAGLGPGLLTESGYALMARAGIAPGLSPGGGADLTPDPTPDPTPDRVLAFCTFLSTAAVLLLAGLGMVLAPFLLALLYGPAYRGAALAVALGLAVAVAHMGNAPAAARLSIVNIRAAGAVNTIWALAIAGAGTLVLGGHGLGHGSAYGSGHGLGPGSGHGAGRAMAAGAMAVYGLGHALSSALVLLLLHRRGCVPDGVAPVSAVGLCAAAGLGGLAVARAAEPAFAAPLTGCMCLVLLAALAVLGVLARRRGWLPEPRQLRAAAGRWMPAREAA